MKNRFKCLKGIWSGWNFFHSKYCTIPTENGSFTPLIMGANWQFIRVFHKLYENANIAFLSLLGEKKKSSDKMLHPVGIEPGPLIASDSKSNTILSTLTLYLLVRQRL